MKFSSNLLGHVSVRLTLAFLANDKTRRANAQKNGAMSNGASDFILHSDLRMYHSSHHPLTEGGSDFFRQLR